MLKEALKLRSQGIIAVYNYIVANGLSDKKIEELKAYIEDQGIKTHIIDIEDIVQKVDYNASFETDAMKFLYEFQKIKDKVIASGDFFILRNLNKLYDNTITEALKKSNVQFLVWYVSFQPSFCPIMTLSGKDGLKFGVITSICTEDKSVTEAFNQGLLDLFQLVKENANASKSEPSQKNRQ